MIPLNSEFFILEYIPSTDSTASECCIPLTIEDSSTSSISPELQVSGGWMEFWRLCEGAQVLE
jgi:hypothetical protein